MYYLLYSLGNRLDVILAGFEDKSKLQAFIENYSCSKMHLYCIIQSDKPLACMLPDEV